MKAERVIDQNLLILIRLYLYSWAQTAQAFADGRLARVQLIASHASLVGVLIAQHTARVQLALASLSFLSFFSSSS